MKTIIEVYEGEVRWDEDRDRLFIEEYWVEQILDPYEGRKIRLTIEELK